MSNRKRRRTGNMLTIKLPTPFINTTLVNQRTPIQIPTGASAERISRPVIKEEKVRVISKHLWDWRCSFSNLSLAWLQFNTNKRKGVITDKVQKKKVKKKKVKRLIATLLGDEEIRNIIIETADIHSELVNAIINILYKELCNLQQKTVIFSP